MLVQKDNLQLIVAEYIDKVIVPKATGWQKMGARAMSFLVGARLNDYLNTPEISSMLKQFEIMNDEGMVDMDFLKAMTLASMNNGEDKTPPVFGYIFDKTDIENLYSIASQFKQG